jgi:hypothetical protein
VALVNTANLLSGGQRSRARTGPPVPAA